MKNIAQAISEHGTDLNSSMADSFNRYNKFSHIIGAGVSFQILNLLISNLERN